MQIPKETFLSLFQRIAQELDSDQISVDYILCDEEQYRIRIGSLHEDPAVINIVLQTIWGANISTKSYTIASTEDQDKDGNFMTHLTFFFHRLEARN